MEEVILEKRIVGLEREVRGLKVFIKQMDGTISAFTAWQTRLAELLETHRQLADSQLNTLLALMQAFHTDEMAEPQA